MRTASGVDWTTYVDVLLPDDAFEHAFNNRAQLFIDYSYNPSSQMQSAFVEEFYD